MIIAYGFEIEMEIGSEMPVVTLLDLHPSRHGDIVRETGLRAEGAGRLRLRQGSPDVQLSERTPNAYRQ